MIRFAAWSLLWLSLFAATPAAAMVYHRGNSSDPETLDPHKTSLEPEAHIMRDLYEGLVAHGRHGDTVPGVATSWTLSDDGLVYVFQFRDDARWSNGDGVVADDFVFSLRRLLDPATGAKYANTLYPIKNAAAINQGALAPTTLGVRALDPLHLEITLENPTPYFLELLTHQSALPVHRASIERWGNDFVKPGHSVTNGAYVPAEWVPGGHLSLRKNPHFHAAAEVRIDEVIYYPTEDRGAALRRFEAGELDSNNDIPTEQIGYIRRKLKAEFHSTPYLGSYYFAFNTASPKLADVRVRRALSMLVDREFLAEDIWGETMLPAYSLVPPGLAHYGAPTEMDFKAMSPFDREDEAVKLLAEAGYGPDHPLKIEIRYNTSENHKNSAIALAGMWQPFGVRVTMVNSDAKTHYAHLRDKGYFEVARAGWIADYADPANFLFLLLSDNDGFNYANYNNPEYDALYQAAARTRDLEERAALQHKAEALIMRDQPFLPLLYYTSKNLVAKRVRGFEDNVRDAHPSRYLWIER